ncbi:hypothetical protein OH77DRAFT_612346 [Trametes cingulata]|nr:hypothetical protein OH77DRAFT_612346 [Trametes cingulata]
MALDLGLLSHTSGGTLLGELLFSMHSSITAVFCICSTSLQPSVFPDHVQHYACTVSQSLAGLAFPVPLPLFDLAEDPAAADLPYARIPSIPPKAASRVTLCFANRHPAQTRRCRGYSCCVSRGCEGVGLNTRRHSRGDIASMH